MRDLLIIRHGESQWNVERRWQGWLDAPLTVLGEKQAQQRAEALAESGYRPAVVHCSDLGRARQTAEIIAGVLGVDCRSDAGFRERNGGEWQGSTGSEIEVRWPGLRDAWRRGEITAPPGGEEDGAVLSRVDAAVAAVLDGPEPAMVVSHHGVLRLIATRAGVDVSALIPNLGGYRFEVESGALVRPTPIAPLDSATELPTAE